jgi:hypothetical protein
MGLTLSDIEERRLKLYIRINPAHQKRRPARSFVDSACKFMLSQSAFVEAANVAIAASRNDRRNQWGALAFCSSLTLSAGLFFNALTELSVGEAAAVLMVAGAGMLKNLEMSRVEKKAAYANLVKASNPIVLNEWTRTASEHGVLTAVTSDRLSSQTYAVWRARELFPTASGKINTLRWKRARKIVDNGSSFALEDHLRGFTVEVVSNHKHLRGTAISIYARPVNLRDHDSNNRRRRDKKDEEKVVQWLQRPQWVPIPVPI